jgi:hypothetical protein
VGKSETAWSVIDQAAIPGGEPLFVTGRFVRLSATTSKTIFWPSLVPNIPARSLFLGGMSISLFMAAGVA